MAEPTQEQTPRYVNLSTHPVMIFDESHHSFKVMPFNERHIRPDATYVVEGEFYQRFLRPTGPLSRHPEDTEGSSFRPEAESSGENESPQDESSNESAGAGVAQDTEAQTGEPVDTGDQNDAPDGGDDTGESDGEDEGAEPEAEHPASSDELSDEQLPPVQKLRAVASDLEITGRTKMSRRQLYDAIVQQVGAETLWKEIESR